MGLGDNIYFKNLFDEDSYAKLKEGPYKIKIRPNTERVLTRKKDSAITGIIKNNVKFSVEANWEATGVENVMSNIIPNIGPLQALKGVADISMGLAGANIGNSGFVTRLFYSQGGYLTLAPEMRVMDWENTGEPLKAAFALMGLCVPRKDSSITIDEIIKTIEDKSKFAEGIFGLAKNKLAKAYQATQKAGTHDTIKTTGKIMNTGANELLNANINLTEAPAPVIVEIGDFFVHNNMVIRSVDFDFSDKMTPAGPQHVDISLSLSSREAMVLDKGGIQGLTLGVQSGKRVTINSGFGGATQ